MTSRGDAEADAGKTKLCVSARDFENARTARMSDGGRIYAASESSSEARTPSRQSALSDRKIDDRKIDDRKIDDRKIDDRKMTVWHFSVINLSVSDHLNSAGPWGIKRARTTARGYRRWLTKSTLINRCCRLVSDLAGQSGGTALRRACQANHVA
jgi:hypothetical protein